MDNPFIGMLACFGFNFPPRNWAWCAGQFETISSNTALYSLLGTQFGGDGRSTFQYPDLRGRVAMGYGTGIGLYPRQMGQILGTETTTLNTTNMPPHSHTATFTPTSGGFVASVQVSMSPATKPQAADGYFIGSNSPFGGNPVFVEDPDTSSLVELGGVSAAGGATGTVTVGTSGDGIAFNNMQPSLGVNWCIALQGLYPSRN
ncbi:hypothetical protein TH25_15765 [Thalassospira profundimaris]|uniref:Phage tail collar domain-containing protein n=1 Tax=Thalassospira profundimaris TaxID=502049 RepID=A0A367WZX3_9PROT|nr:tail fiber protein [Thalassospira profundimaris]RCK46986.1 hypothetical protein TH25_15765 [Thalassospira profundimaris]